jgi:ferredoxin-NADP reductase
LLAGGGSGIVPLMSMLRHRARSGMSVEAALIYSSRSAEEIIYRDELKSFERDPSLRVTVTLTRQAPQGWTGRTGRIDATMLKESGFLPRPEAKVFICGSNGFVETAARSLIALGHVPERIKTERFGPSG